VLKQRNALLHAGSASPAALDAWDAEFAAAGGTIQRARSAYTESLTETFQRTVAEHSYHVRNLQISYRPSIADDLRALRRDELRARVSLSGPQRDNIEFTLDGRNASEVVSAGEQRMLVLFMKFAKLELFRQKFDEPALFLLDDIDAELDLDVLQKLLSRLPSKTQVFATSAKERFLAVLQAGPHRRLVIENGRVASADDFA
jgi:DNA replication and repair protein RecF